MLFCLAVGLATVIDAHATQVRNDYHDSYYYNDFDYGRLYPSTVPGRAASVSALSRLRITTTCVHSQLLHSFFVKLQAFGFLTSFAVIGLIPLMWLKYCLETRRSRT